MIKISNEVEEERERAGDSSLKSCKYWKLQVNNPWAAKIVSSFGQEQEKKILVVMNWLLGKITLIAFGYSPTWSWACFIVCSREEADLAYGIFEKKRSYVGWKKNVASFIEVSYWPSFAGFDSNNMETLQMVIFFLLTEFFLTRNNP